jgi:hypothetical protein
MLAPLATLHIEVVPSPSTNDHEVRLLDPADSLIARFDDSMMGLDPVEILIAPSTLHATDVEHIATVGRCACGVTECGSVEVRIRREGEHVFWQATRSATIVRFLASAYDAELTRALNDFSWETPERTTARLVRASLDHALLQRSGLTFSWASGRSRKDHFTIALMLEPGPYQLIVCVPWNGESPEALSRTCLELLHSAPTSWPNVEWYPQAAGLAVPPAIGGPGWRAG